MNVVEACASVKNADEIFCSLCIFCGHNDAGIMYHLQWDGPYATIIIGRYRVA